MFGQKQIIQKTLCDMSSPLKIQLDYYEIYKRKRDDCLIALMEYVEHVVVNPQALNSLDQVFVCYIHLL